MPPLANLGGTFLDLLSERAERGLFSLPTSLFLVIKAHFSR